MQTRGKLRQSAQKGCAGPPRDRGAVVFDRASARGMNACNDLAGTPGEDQRHRLPWGDASWPSRVIRGGLVAHRVGSGNGCFNSGRQWPLEAGPIHLAAHPGTSHTQAERGMHPRDTTVQSGAGVYDRCGTSPASGANPQQGLTSADRLEMGNANESCNRSPLRRKGNPADANTPELRASCSEAAP